MEIRYQIVGTDNPANHITADELAARFDVSGKKEAPHLRRQLQSEPVLEGLCGPMWGGWFTATGQHVFLEDDDAPEGPRKPYCRETDPVAYYVVRYETWAAYEALSR